jgi:hypothetical protein
LALMLMAPALISETCNVPSCRVFILCDPRADPVPVVLWTSADRSEQPPHNSGPTTKPAPMKPVLATTSRRPKTGPSVVLDVVSRLGLGISAPDKNRFQ